MTEQEQPTMKLTAAAEKFIRRMMRFSEDAKAGFRLKVRHGGCSGFAVGFDLAGGPASNEIVWEKAGVRIFLDAESSRLLNGATVDFRETVSESGLVVVAGTQTPQACGSNAAFVSIQALTQR